MDPRLHACVVCKALFNNSAALTTHRDNSHGEAGSLICFDCMLEFPSDASLLAHHDQEHGRSHTWKCGYCPDRGWDHDGLLPHVQLYHQDILSGSKSHAKKSADLSASAAGPSASKVPLLVKPAPGQVADSQKNGRVASSTSQGK